MSTHRDTRSSSRQFGFVAAITLGAAVLRLTRLGSESFWIDEVSQSRTATLIGNHGWRAVASRDNVSPLSHFLLWMLQHLFGNSELVARLPGTIAGIVLVPVAYTLAKLLFTARIGLISAVLVAVAPYGLWYSRDARMYSLLSLASAVYLLWFVNVLREPRRRTMVALVAVGAVGMYVHEYFIFVMIGTSGFAALRYFRSNRKLVYRLAVANAISLAAFVPWIVALSSYNQGNAGSQRGGVLLFGPYALLSYFIGFNFGPSIRDMQTAGAATAMRQNIGTVTVPVLLVVGIAGALVVKLRNHIRSKNPDDSIYLVTFVVAVLIGLPVLATVVSSRINFNVRYCATALVPVMILVAAAVDDLRRKRLANMLWATLAAVIALASFRVIWPGARYAREDIRGVSRALSARPPAGPLIVESYTVVEGLRWYGFNGQLVEVRNTADPAIAAVIEGRHQVGDTVTVVQSREWETDAHNDVVKRLTAAGFSLDSTSRFAGASVRRFAFSGTKP